MASPTDDSVFALRADDELVITWLSRPLARLWPSGIGHAFVSHLAIPDELVTPLVQGAGQARQTGQPVNVGDYLFTATAAGMVVFIHPDGLSTLVQARGMRSSTR